MFRHRACLAEGDHYPTPSRYPKALWVRVEGSELKLGCDLLDFDEDKLCEQRGKTYDTILTMSALGVDVCVIRHPEVDYYKELDKSPTITASIVNGGTVQVNTKPKLA